MQELHQLCLSIHNLSVLEYDKRIESASFYALANEFERIAGDFLLASQAETTRFTGPNNHRLGAFSVSDNSDRYRLTLQAYAACDPSPAHLRWTVEIGNKDNLPDLISFECAARACLASFSPTDLKALFQETFTQPFEVDAYTIDEVGPLMAHTPPELIAGIEALMAYGLQASKEDAATWQRAMRQLGNLYEAFAGVGARSSNAFKPFSISRNITFPHTTELLHLNFEFFNRFKHLLWSSVNVVPKAMQP